MGQTLTHGVYLPDEGERNCYAGLAANWQILDTSVGTIASHTSQIAGKAPAVHTHTKSDITDLFNSANTWTGYNTFTSYIASKESAAIPTGGYGKGIAFQDYQNNRLGYIQPCLTSDNAKRLLIGADAGDIASNSNIIPHVNNFYNLGSSTYQWNNLYAKGYYYNGTAWGLDKVNTWSAQQIFVGNNSRGLISMYNPAYTKGSALSVTDLSIGTIYMGDGGQQGLANSLSFISTDLAANGAKTLLSLSAMENTASSGTRTNVVIQYDKNDTANPKKVSIGGALIPNPDATFPLGTPTFRWKSLNGINPGALSLPNLIAETYDPSNGWYDLDTTDWDLTGSPVDISSNVLKDGYLYVCLACDSTGYVVICEGVFGYPNSYYSTSGLPITGYARALLPVRRGTNVRLYLKGTSVYGARLFPALGNV